MQAMPAINPRIVSLIVIRSEFSGGRVSKRVFKPEFLNRLDDIIVFHQLERNDLIKVVDLEVAKVIARVRAKDIKVRLDLTAVEFLIDKGYDPNYGARPMRRAVEKYLEDPLAEELLRGNIKQGDTLNVHAAGEQLAFKLAQPEQSEPANGSPLRSRGVMPAVRLNEGCHCSKVDSKSLLSTFARICSTKREPRGTFKVLCLISEGLACDAATITQGLPPGLPPLCLCNGQMDRLPRPCECSSSET